MDRTERSIIRGSCVYPIKIRSNKSGLASNDPSRPNVENAPSWSHKRYSVLSSQVQEGKKEERMRKKNLMTAKVSGDPDIRAAIS